MCYVVNEKEYNDNIKKIEKIIEKAEFEKSLMVDSPELEYRYLRFPKVQMDFDLSKLDLTKIKKLTDEELVLLIQLITLSVGWENYKLNMLFAEIYKRYEKMIFKLKGKYYSNKGLDQNDYFAAGLRGFMELFQHYKFANSKEASVKTFLWRCASGKMSTMLKQADAAKHQGLNEAESFNGTASASKDGRNDERYDYINIIKNDHTPEYEISEKIIMYKILTRLKFTLTELEFNAIYSEIIGYNYSGASKELGVSEKSIDNAINRARVKFKRYQTEIAKKEKTEITDYVKIKKEVKEKWVIK